MKQRRTLGECRSDGRTIAGTALRYGERSPSHRERFAPGAFGSLADGVNRVFNLHHNPLQAIAWTDGGGLTLRDTGEALELEARAPAIPAGDLAIRGLEAGSLGGLSVEFRAEAERRDGDTRIIERATLAGVGLVANPSYPGSLAEVRSGVEVRAFSVTASIEYGGRLACDCGVEGCDTVEFGPSAFAADIAAAEAGERDILAVVGNYSQAVASVSAGTLALNNTRAGLNVSIGRLPDTDAARDLREQAASVPVYLRPIIREREGGVEVQETEAGRTAIFSDVELRGFTLGATDRSGGWQPITIADAEGRNRIHRTAYQRPIYQRPEFARWL